ncbi:MULTISPECIES: acyl-CoA carboxylase subunit beta [Auritidibacter]|uniref:acyl-CoA carboxylase subunit beta n=1 Tax=Auritidibacter TaxID=1160973 RepID=UPI00169CD6DA|nr:MULTISPECIES: acyl-CoA carboxylase subunit beta [Auritidibacter]NIH72773.1 propionyl-CoA carboxylase beta chain [Auritidibacter ignavus]WGH82612.1 acyl-CoA carboxylase subunit beta [Auritidibacter ignavus]WGH84820.1 acyl-CoA carboxylase subunit beta [Auritidibacter ignavus]WGH87197.1 acyl-CoA carboxylase subunit beta [Auritidibacter ignavus]WGH89483.1 acyl-CoA carboxylase subunit beta [Auritidibacter ignavus]
MSTEPDQAGQTTPDLTTTAGKLEDFFHRRESAMVPSGQVAIDRQHSRGKATARERLDELVDDGSFVEFDQLRVHRTTSFGMDAKHPEGDGLVSGYGTIDGRLVAVYAQDFTVFGGSLSKVNGEKIVKVQQFAARNGCPIIGINDGGGARIQEGVDSLAMFADIFRNNVLASGVIPQISIIMGPAAGGAAYSPALTDFVVMVDQTSHMFITGPDVIKAVTGEDIDMETLGGARSHNERTGTAAYLAEDEADAFDWVRELLDYLPAHNYSDGQIFDVDPDLATTEADLSLNTIVPDSANQPYNMLDVVATLVDDGAFLEVQQLYAPSVIVGFGRMDGRSVGVVANQPMQFAGTLDIAASEKAARFVRFCDAFNIPIVTLVDVPGFLPGTDQEFNGIIRRGAKLIYAYAEATVPKITVITRKAYGGAYIVMGSKKLGADLNLAWPTAQIGVMGAQGAVNILYRRELAKVADEGGDVETRRQELIEDYEAELLNPYQAAESGYVDAVIAPSETRAEIVKAIRATVNKRESRPYRKHGNIPL